MSTRSRMSRRGFLASAVAASAAPWIVPASVLGRTHVAPSERIGIGVVGLGGRGFNLLNGFLAEHDAEVVALCDVDRLHYRDNRWGEKQAYGLEGGQALVTKRRGNGKAGGAAAVPAYTDFRQLCARDDLDAVVIATPDHWHAFIALEALRNGQDVYCEKPVTHFFHEGQAVYREAARREAVFQAGSQQRSDARFRRAVELIRNGHTGKVKKVEVGLPAGYDKPAGDPKIQKPPETLDYDFWCGPSPKLPYMRARHHRWWRGHRAYGGGTLMDWIGHHNDIAHWALDLDDSGPVHVAVEEWTAPTTDIYNGPRHYTIRCEYPGGTVSTISSHNEIGTKWVGEDGWVFADRGVLRTSEPRWAKRKFDPGPEKVYASPRHTRNFLDCVKSREACVAPAETAHRSITPGHLAWLAQAIGKPVQWDPKAERIVNDEAADAKLRSAEYRDPWTLDEAGG